MHNRRRERHRRCVVPECRRHALLGRAAQAAVHRLAGDITVALAPVGDAPGPLQAWGPDQSALVAAGDAKRRAAQVFRERLLHGDYGAILDTPVARLAEQAAMRRGLADELGALRLLLVRLLGAALAADDPARLAQAAAQVANAATRAARAHDALVGGQDQFVLDHLLRQLGDGSPGRRPRPPTQT